MVQLIQCAAMTKKGFHCPTWADRDSEFCHVHRPDGEFARQHPKMVVRLWMEPSDQLELLELPQ